ncbi:YitT family protein [Aquibacillus halophilus]|uniref:YitT family protein n=1 Tax=Aquibacillus halophilus TaxID=930132 RepID=A0A6A8D9X6_9BACI|nr:YitT family protein [Aquibacillus halophilus]MRH42563.1 YitT family protein [Aquibacillus halophilus]
MRSTLRAYIIITCGSFIQGMAMALFLFPHAIPSGGAGGIAVLLNYWFNIPLSFALWLVNFTLLASAIKWLGNASTIGTMYTITITSISVHIFSMDIFSHHANVWVDLIIGSIVLGIGVGILLRQQVSNGGMGVIALIFAKFRNIPPGKPLLLLNGFIFILTASIIAWEIVVQALISQWISTRILDIVYNLKLTIYRAPTLSWRKK